MPRKPKRPCRYPGCNELTYGVYCDKHKALIDKQYDKTKRNDHAKKYGNNWRRIRAAYVTRHPFCEECLKQGRYVPVDEVHHIVPLDWGGTNDFSNLMSLCQSCHTKKHIELGDRKRPGGG